MTKTQEPPQPILWQPERHLRDDDRIVIMTDIEIVWSRYYDFSPEQQLFRVGGSDTRSGCVGFFKFGRDLAFDMIMGGVPVAPWNADSPPIGIEVHRRSHGNHAEGRFRGEVSIIDVEPDVLAVVPEARRRFRQEGHSPNATIGMWSKLEERANRELAIEKAARAMVGKFKVSQIKDQVGGDAARISRVLKRMVQNGLLKPVGKKYEVAPPSPLIERADWTD